MDPNDPTRIQPAAGPPPGPHGQEGWPPPDPYGQPVGYDAAPTAAYPAAAPPPPPYVAPGSGPYGRGPRPAGPPRGLLITGGILARLLAGVIGFIVGVQVEKGRKPSSTVAAGSTTSTTSTTPGKKAGKAGPKVTGTVGAVSGNGFTVTQKDGTTANVVVSSSTRFTKAGAAGSLQDVTPGIRVVVTGARDQNGAVTATMVVIGKVRGAGGGGQATTTVP